MLNQPLMEKLLAMRLQGMVEALKTQEQDRASNELTFLERLPLLVDQQWTWRENQALKRRLKAAKLRGPACVEVPPLKAIAPTQKEPPFAIAQLAVLVLFVVLTTFAVKKFRIEPMTVAKSSAKAA